MQASLTPDVIAGKHIWHRKNCINCHTLLGEGAYYAPDLTKITQQRGAPYLQAFLKDPAKFYSEERDRRLMTNPNLSDREIDQVIAFLDWVSQINTQGWPPAPHPGLGIGHSRAADAGWARPGGGLERAGSAGPGALPARPRPAASPVTPPPAGSTWSAPLSPTSAPRRRSASRTRATRGRRPTRPGTSASPFSTRTPSCSPDRPTRAAGARSCLPGSMQSLTGAADRSARRLSPDPQVGTHAMRYRTQRVAYAYWVVALLLYGLQMVFGLLAAAKYLGPDPHPRLSALRPGEGDSHQSADRLGADGVHGRRLLGGSGGIAHRAALAPPRLLEPRTLDPGRGDGRGRIPFRLDRGEQAAGATLSGEAGHRRGHAAVPLQRRV